MNERPPFSSLDTTTDSPLNAAIALYLEGKVKQEDLLARHPELRSELLAFFADEKSVARRVAGQSPTALNPTPAAQAGSDERYHIISRLGEGGMGVVLRAYDTLLDREVAFKVLKGEAARIPERIRRMQEEARIAAGLNHPGIVPVHDAGVTSDGRPFITMKLVEGQPLSQLLKERGHPTDWFLDVFLRVCEAVAYAHGRPSPVLHRDLKPSNIMVGAYGEVQVMDWGLAKILEDTGPRQAADGPADDSSSNEPAEDATRTGVAVGTFAYMPPEQARGEKERIGPASDVFALGAVLHVILTGKPLYQGRKVEMLALAQGAGLPAVWQRLAESGEDPDLIAIAQRCLQEAPEARFAHAGELVARLQEYQQLVRERGRLAELAQARVETRRKWRLVAGCILAVAVLLGWAYWNWRQKRGLETNNRGRIELSRVYGLREDTQHLQVGDLEKNLTSWMQAKQAMEQFEGLAASELEEPIRVELLRVRDEIDAAVEQEGRQLRLVRGVHEAGDLIGMRVVEFADDSSEALATYRKAFQEYGIDLASQTPEQMSKKVSEMLPVVRNEVLIGMDLWSLISSDDAVKLRPVVEELDDDPWRKRLRKAIETDDLATLQRLAKEARKERLPPPFFRILGVALRVGGAIEESVQLLERGTFVHPKVCSLHLELARSREKQFPWAGAKILSCYKAAVACDDKNALAWAGWAYALGMAGENQKADEYFEKALALAPDNHAIRISRGGVRVLREERSALDDVRGLYARYPDRADVAGILARTLAPRAGSLAEAKRILHRAQQLDKDHPQVHLAEAFVAMAEKRYTDFLAIIRELRRVDAGEQTLVSAECLGLLTTGEFEEAEKLARRCLSGGQLPPFLARPVVQLLAYSLILQGRPAEAEPWARQALELHTIGTVRDPDGKSRVTLLQCLLQQGRFEEAVTLFRSMSSDSASAQMLRGFQGNVLQHCQELQKVLSEGSSRPPNWIDYTLLAEIALARGMPRVAYPRYLKLLGQEKPDFAMRMMAVSPSLLWVNELYRLSLRANGARAAVRAVCEESKEGLRIVDEQRQKCRQQALTWLKLELDNLRKSAQRAAERPSVNGLLCFLQCCPDFAFVRDPAQLEKVPKEERENWKKFWDEVDALRRSVRPTAEPKRER